MFVAKKVHKLSFIIIIVFSTTLIWLVMAGMASNKGVKMDATIAPLSSPVPLNNPSSQIAGPINRNVVLVGLKTDDNTLIQHDQNIPSPIYLSGI